MSDKNWDELKKSYEALLPLPEFPDETTWVDRLRTWEEFVDRGPDVAQVLSESNKEFEKQEYEEDIRGLAPELHDLLMEVFG